MTLLRVQDLSVHFRVSKGFRRSSGDIVHAVDNVSFTIDRGETLGLVGESGSGKTTVARAILQLTRPTTGTIHVDGRQMGHLKGRARRDAMRHVQIVFQDPYSSLNPRMTVHNIIAEPLQAHGRMRGAELEERVMSLLEMVGLGTQHLWRRPHEFSGGQCQRIAIARALALEPRLVVLDEPTSALDVSVQARILVLLKELQSRLGLAYLFIAHDLAVVESMAATIAVMYAGELVEEGPADDVFRAPLHPYTAALLKSVPSPDPHERSEMRVLEGDVPSAVHPPAGCRFRLRCERRMEICAAVSPPRVEMGPRVVRCHLFSGPREEDAAPGMDAARPGREPADERGRPPTTVPA